MRKIVIASLLVLVMALPALAETKITIPPTWTGATGQQYFEDFSRDLGLAISYMPLAPAEPLGGVLPHVDLGVEVTAVEIDKDKQYWKDIEATAGQTLPSTLVFPKLHVQVGLPVIPIDLGFVYSTVPSTNVKYMGGEVKWAILKGGVATPAIAIRGAYTQLSGVQEMDLTTKSADISISKGFAIFTPYAGAGMVWIDSKEKSTTVTLADVSISEPKWFLGFKLTFFPLMNMVLEADFAEVTAYSFRLNLHI